MHMTCALVYDVTLRCLCAQHNKGPELVVNATTSFRFVLFACLFDCLFVIRLVFIGLSPSPSLHIRDSNKT